MGIFGFFSKEKKESLDQGLQKTNESIFSKLSKAIVGKSKVDEEVLDELEEVLIGSDLGVETTVKVIQRIEARVARDKYVDASELDLILREEIASLLEENNTQDLLDFDLPADKKPYVILVVGVNGVGKTTTIGKLAHLFKNAGKSVILGAADTFRAAAVDQLILWGQRVGTRGLPRHEYRSCIRGLRRNETRIRESSRSSHHRYCRPIAYQGQFDERAHQNQAGDAKIYPGSPPRDNAGPGRIYRSKCLSPSQGIYQGYRSDLPGHYQTGRYSQGRSSNRHLRPIQNSRQIYRGGRKDDRPAALQPHRVCRLAL